MPCSRWQVIKTTRKCDLGCSCDICLVWYLQTQIHYNERRKKELKLFAAMTLWVLLFSYLKSWIFWKISTEIQIFHVMVVGTRRGSSNWSLGGSRIRSVSRHRSIRLHPVRMDINPDKNVFQTFCSWYTIVFSNKALPARSVVAEELVSVYRPFMRTPECWKFLVTWKNILKMEAFE